MSYLCKELMRHKTLGGVFVSCAWGLHQFAWGSCRYLQEYLKMPQGFHEAFEWNLPLASSF